VVTVYVVAEEIAVGVPEITPVALIDNPAGKGVFTVVAVGTPPVFVGVIFTGTPTVNVYGEPG
jgi:hypothetical protein